MCDGVLKIRSIDLVFFFLQSQDFHPVVTSEKVVQIQVYKLNARDDWHNKKYSLFVQIEKCHVTDRSFITKQSVMMCGAMCKQYSARCDAAERGIP